MKVNITDYSVLNSITPEALNAYVRAEGWRSGESYRTHSTIYTKDGISSEIIIPKTHDLGDYVNVVADLLRFFARLEDRDELEILKDLSTADKDVIRIRSIIADSDGSIPISVGTRMFSSAKDLVLSAACAAWRRQYSYRAGKVAEAEEYMSRLRLGQTEHGSYVINLLSPVPPVIEEQPDLWPDKTQETHSRRVTRYLADGLDAAAKAIETYNSSPGSSAFIDAVKSGVSANLCDAIASLSDQGQGIEVSVTWSRNRPAPQKRWIRTFSSAQGETLKEAARILREKQPRDGEYIEGRIIKLQSYDSSFEGHITIQAFVDGRLSSIQTELDSVDYNKAIDAHKNGQLISTSGKLERTGARWHLIKPTPITVIGDDSSESDT